MSPDTESALSEVLSKGPPVRFAVVFGSVATDRARPDSDLDLAVSFIDEPTLAAELDLQVDLERAAGRSVDLVRLDRASTLLAWQIARTGRLLVGERAAWVRFQATAASAWCDFGPRFEAAARRFRERLADAGTRVPTGESEAR